MPKGSTIVVTASLAGLVGIPDDPIYGLTKHAVVGFVRSVAPQLAERGIRIQAVCPGWADTAPHAARVQGGARARGFRLLTAGERRRRRVGRVPERGHGRGMDRAARPRAAALRVQGRARARADRSVAAGRPAVGERADAQAGSATRTHSRRASARGRRGLSRRAPRCSAGPTRTAAAPCPPVPTTNSRMPRAGSSSPLGVLRREALVVVVVSDEDDVGAGRRTSALPERRRTSQSLPCVPDEKRGWCQYASVQRAGCAARSVPQPLLLGRAVRRTLRPRSSSS